MQQPTYVSALQCLAASHGLAGRLKEARKAMERLRIADPTFTASTPGDRIPLRRTEDLAKLSEGLRLAGLPE